MPQGSFTESHPQIRPPAYCFTQPVPLPPPIPGDPPGSLQGYARWTDLDPLASIDVAIYTQMPRIAQQWEWYGCITRTGIIFDIRLQRIADPNPWRLTLRVWDPWRHPEVFTFDNQHIQTEPTINTGLLTDTHIPGIDFRTAQVMQ